MSSDEYPPKDLTEVSKKNSLIILALLVDPDKFNRRLIDYLKFYNINRVQRFQKQAFSCIIYDTMAGAETSAQPASQSITLNAYGS